MSINVTAGVVFGFPMTEEQLSKIEDTEAARYIINLDEKSFMFGNLVASNDWYDDMRYSPLGDLNIYNERNQEMYLTYLKYFTDDRTPQYYLTQEIDY